MRYVLILSLLFCPAAEPQGLVITVRSTDLDRNGHVGNAHIVGYLQDARWDWLGRRGLTHARLRELGCILVVARLEVDYRAELNEGDRLVVRAQPQPVTANVGESMVWIAQEVRKSDGKVAVRARVLMIGIDPMTRHSAPLPDVLVQAINSRAEG